MTSEYTVFVPHRMVEIKADLAQIQPFFLKCAILMKVDVLFLQKLWLRFWLNDRIFGYISTILALNVFPVFSVVFLLRCTYITYRDDICLHCTAN